MDEKERDKTILVSGYKIKEQRLAVNFTAAIIV